MTTVIILAMVFVFVALRLWSVLGRRTGHEQSLPKPMERAPLIRGVPKVLGGEAHPAPEQEQPGVAAASPGLRAIASADPKFDVARFVEGAKNAYGLILEAFWRGDEEELKGLVDGDVAHAFSAAIADRKAEGLVLDNRLVAIESAHVEEAWVDGQTAYVRIRFEADIAAVTRNTDGDVVAGSLSDAVPTHDVWTFSRMLRSSDPNWMLTETDEAA